MTNERIYLDYHATTPCDPRVHKVMEPYFFEEFGNAASKHAYGWPAKNGVEEARRNLAKLLNCSPAELFFTASATEANNLTLFGVAEYFLQNKITPHFITTNIEHKSVLNCFTELNRRGVEITIVPVENDGVVDIQKLISAIQPNTKLISVMMANNEIGTLQPVADIGEVCRLKEIYFHTDAVQAVGRLPIDVEAMKIDLLTLSAHKFYGPKGVGAMYIRARQPRVKIKPVHFGAGQEGGMRSGTLNTPGIVGLGEAARLALLEMKVEAEKQRGLRDSLKTKLLEGLSGPNKTGLKVNGSLTHRLPNNLNITIENVPTNELLSGIKELCVSTGAACSATDINPSHVLTALGLSAHDARCSMRFGLGRWTTQNDIDKAASLLIQKVKEVRGY